MKSKPARDSKPARPDAMNYADRYELFLIRVLDAHCSGLRKAIRRFLAERAAGRETDRERFRSIIARGVCKAALRTAPIGFAPSRILKCALSAFPNQKDALEDFLGDMWGLNLVVEILGSAYKKRLRPPPPNLTRD